MNKTPFSITDEHINAYIELRVLGLKPGDEIEIPPDATLKRFGAIKTLEQEVAEKK